MFLSWSNCDRPLFRTKLTTCYFLPPGCCAQCSALAGCDGFSFLPGNCYLKKGVTALLPKPGVVSSRLQHAPLLAAPRRALA